MIKGWIAHSPIQIESLMSMKGRGFYNFSVFFTFILHLVWGIGVITFGIGAGKYDGGVSWVVFQKTFGIYFWAWGMIVSSFFAIPFMLEEFSPGHRSQWRFLLVLPQQIILTMVAAGTLATMFPIIPGFEFSKALRVAPVYILLLIFHTFELLREYRGSERCGP